MKNKIAICLWFDGKAKEAATFYCSVFKDANITAENPLVTAFEASGYQFICLNGGPDFKFNPSISFYIVFEDENEIDEVWKKLSLGGNVLMPLNKYDWSEKYGWVQDKFGVTWQLSFGKLSDVGQVFTPSLMFVGDQYGKAKDAINHYTAIFKNSVVDGILPYGKDEAPDVEGAVKHAQFSLNGNKFMVMESNHSHNFSFNEAISLVVKCDNQSEIDYFWEKLTEGGKESNCGWLKDKFGVSWQIVPTVLEELMSNPEKSERVTQAFLKMKKFDIEKLKQA